MKTEFEITFLNIDREKLVNKIKNLWWICIKENTLMRRHVFELANDVEHMCYFRVRDEGDKITTTYKELWEWVKDIESVKELETTVWDFDAMIWIFKKAGLVPFKYEESYREIWEVNWEIEIMIDLWPWLNLFVEIEWESEELVRKYTELLWFDYSKWIFGSVSEIYKIELGIDFEAFRDIKEITFDKIPKKNEK